MTYAIRTEAKHKISAWVDTKLYDRVKALNSDRGALAHALNEGMRLYVEKQLQAKPQGNNSQN